MFYADIINSLKTNFFFRRSTPCTAKAVFVTTTTSNTTLLKVDPNNSIYTRRTCVYAVRSHVAQEKSYGLLPTLWKARVHPG